MLMHNVFLRGLYPILRNTRFVLALILIDILLNGGGLLAADAKSDATTSLQELIELALKHNSKDSVNEKHLAPENVSFLVKKYFYQIETKVEQLATAKEVRGHFQKGIKKSEEVFDSGEGVVSQADITKLKLGLSNTLNDIINLEYELKIARLNLDKLINQELRGANDIKTSDPLPIDFSYTSFGNYLKEKHSTTQKNKAIGDAGIKLNKTDGNKESSILTEENRLLLHKAFLNVKLSKDKVMLGKKNRRITRALLVAEVANYDFGIGDPQDLFEALIIYTRVFSSY
ncbi:uncharacterized protein METZ01_LOCUS325810, partial [marine metagenome]